MLNSEKWKSSFRYANSSVLWRSPCCAKCERTQTKTNKTTSFLGSKIYQKSMKIVAAPALIAKIDKTAASRPQFFIQSPILSQFWDPQGSSKSFQRRAELQPRPLLEPTWDHFSSQNPVCINFDSILASSGLPLCQFCDFLLSFWYSVQASKPPVASAGDAKRKQSAARSSRQACQTPREAKHADMHVPFGHADMHVRHDFSHVLVGGMQSGGRRNHQNRCIS